MIIQKKSKLHISNLVMSEIKYMQLYNAIVHTGLEISTPQNIWKLPYHI